MNSGITRQIGGATSGNMVLTKKGTGTMKTLKTRIWTWSALGLAILALGLVPLNAQAAAYTWSGTTSNVWNLASNWNSAGPPGGSYTDTATIGINHNEPVILTTTALLGGLTITSSANTSALTINSGGALEMQGNIANSKTITINLGGIVDNASGGTMSMNGTITMGGGRSLPPAAALSSTAAPSPAVVPFRPP